MFEVKLEDFVGSVILSKEEYGRFIDCIKTLEDKVKEKTLEIYIYTDETKKSFFRCDPKPLLGCTDDNYEFIKDWIIHNVGPYVTGCKEGEEFKELEKENAKLKDDIGFLKASLEAERNSKPFTKNIKKSVLAKLDQFYKDKPWNKTYSR